jgi:hypothetical protein
MPFKKNKNQKNCGGSNAGNDAITIRKMAAIFSK